METLDCRAQRCPHPVVETRKLLLAHPDQPPTVLVGDTTARDNVTRLAKSQGFAVNSRDTEGHYRLELTPQADPSQTEAQPLVRGKTVALISTDQLGQGDPELGRILMKNFLYTMTETEQVPDQLLFLNNGVKLTVQGSEVLEALEQLANLGTDIASCGLCLDFYGLKEQLAVGRVGNMLETVEALQSAGRIIRL